MQELHHEKALGHFSDIQAVCESLSIVSKLSIVDENWTQLTHSEVLATQILKLNQWFFGLFISADLINKNASTLGFTVRVFFSINKHEQFVDHLQLEKVVGLCFKRR